MPEPFLNKVTWNSSKYIKVPWRLQFIQPITDIRMVNVALGIMDTRNGCRVTEVRSGLIMAGREPGIRDKRRTGLDFELNADRAGGEIMNTKKVLLTGLLIGLLALVFSQAMAATGVSYPVITAYFAPEQGRYGDPLRIYLSAEDPNGKMLRIATQVTQVGYGSYPTDWVYLKPQYKKGFAGYLQWNTMSNHTRFMPEWTRITIKISVLDESGNESNEIVLPYEFVTERINSQVPAPFNQEHVAKLGHIDVNLFNPFKMEDHDDNIFRR